MGRCILASENSLKKGKVVEKHGMTLWGMVSHATGKIEANLVSCQRLLVVPGLGVPCFTNFRDQLSFV